MSGKSATLDVMRAELVEACSGLLGSPVPSGVEVNRNGAVVAGTPQSSPLIKNLHWEAQLATLGPEGFCIHSVRLSTHRTIVIAANSELGALYGAFHFLRLMQTLKPIDNLDVSEKPRVQLRMLDHWDNLDGTLSVDMQADRSGTGANFPTQSILDCETMLAPTPRSESTGPDQQRQRQRAILTAEYLGKVAAIADLFRPYGVRVYLSARFSAPIELGGLKTADPLDRKSAGWWKHKADEIYRLIPDFGGFVVKANSEGQPGPRTYNRSHADGANMLAAAVAPHNGLVIWRAFVYDMKPGYDRAGAAYAESAAIRRKVCAERAAASEEWSDRLSTARTVSSALRRDAADPGHAGISNHPGVPGLFKSSRVSGADVARVFGLGHLCQRTRLDGNQEWLMGACIGQRITGIAGVANTGTDRNWTGHQFLQANWYAFGRLAWNPDLASQQIAERVDRDDAHARSAGKFAAIARVMLESREAVVDYMTPLGLHHLMWGGHHYGPAPWWDKEKRDDWNPVYYHRADARRRRI